MSARPGFVLRRRSSSCVPFHPLAGSAARSLSFFLRQQRRTFHSLVRQGHGRGPGRHETPRWARDQVGFTEEGRGLPEWGGPCLGSAPHPTTGATHSHTGSSSPEATKPDMLPEHRGTEERM